MPPEPVVQVLDQALALLDTIDLGEPATPAQWARRSEQGEYRALLYQAILFLEGAKHRCERAVDPGPLQGAALWGTADAEEAGSGGS